jgi:hypothetical protein
MASPFVQEGTLTRSEYEQLRGDPDHTAAEAVSANGHEARTCSLAGCEELVSGRGALYCSSVHQRRAKEQRAQQRLTNGASAAPVAPAVINAAAPPDGPSAIWAPSGTEADLIAALSRAGATIARLDIAFGGQAWTLTRSNGDRP